MAFREVRVFEVREVLRVWLSGEGVRSIERLVGVDRKTVRRYVGAAESLGLVRDGSEEQLTDAFVGMVVEAVRPHRTDGHGESWRLLAANHDQIAEWVGADLTAVKIHELLGRRGVMVPCRTVQRYVLEVCGRNRGRGPTVRVADGEPGDELQVDFGRMGLIFDSVRRLTPPPRRPARRRMGWRARRRARRVLGYGQPRPGARYDRPAAVGATPWTSPTSKSCTTTWFGCASPTASRRRSISARTSTGPCSLLYARTRPCSRR